MAANPIVVNGYYADQGGVQDWGKSYQFTAAPASLVYLTAFNKSLSTVYIELYDAATATGTPRVLPCAAGSVVGWGQLRMGTAIFVRAVDAASGGSLIGSNDVKFDCGYLNSIGA